MKRTIQISLFSLIFLFSYSMFSQDISLYHQFNGRYDFLFFGNTLNKMENGLGGRCEINTSASATLNLNPTDVIENAYLYWAGSGSGDFNVKLNDRDILAQRTFTVTQNSSNLPFFSAFADVTTQIQATGNGVYTFSDLDLTSVINKYCGNATNFGGWAIIVVYKNESLPLNLLNVYDGLQYVPREINIALNRLNVIDNQGAKIGFVAWEGDRFLKVNETLRINGNPISNPPLNPEDNAFNGTNTFTNSDVLYNMDLDVYDIQNNIKIGDNSAQIQLTSGQDFVMINAIVTKLNSQLPDATIQIDGYKSLECDSRKIEMDYTVFNINSTNSLPLETPIAIYANGVFIQSTATTTTIPVDGNEKNQITLLIPDSISLDFNLQIVVDDSGNGTGIVTELDENNNTDLIPISLLLSPKFNPLSNIENCNEGLGSGTFDFSDYERVVKVNPNDVVEFYLNQTDAENAVNPIFNPSNFKAATTPKPIFIRISNKNCSSITSFLLTTKICPPQVFNFISPNNDGRNDTFLVEGLRDVFLNFKTSIYNRWGTLVWTGNNNTSDWDGFANKGILLDDQSIPTGTYYYIIELNEVDYPNPLTGFLYLTK